MKGFKKNLLLILTVSFLCVSCGTGAGMTGTGSNSNSSAGNNSSSDNSGNFIFDMLGSILGNYATLTAKDLQGTWNYTGTDCRFKSENLLKQAGGEVAATEIEKKLDDAFSKVGIGKGTCTFTFNADNSYSATLGGKSISGTYAFDEANKKLNLTYLMGLGNLEANVTKTGTNGISLLFDADKILNLVSLVATVSNNTTVKAIGSLAGQYDGLLAGFEMKK